MLILLWPVRSMCAENDLQLVAYLAYGVEPVVHVVSA